MDTRSPIARAIDKACGIPDGPPKTDNRKPWVTLRCKTCKREQKVRKEETDPEGTKLVLLNCPECHRGDFDEPAFFDAAGREIVWKG